MDRVHLARAGPLLLGLLLSASLLAPLAPELILMNKGRLTLLLEGNKVKSLEVHHYKSYREK